MHLPVNECLGIYISLLLHVSLVFIFAASLDTLASAIQLNLTVYEEEKEKQNTHKVYTKEDFNVVSRFESKFEYACDQL